MKLFLVHCGFYDSDVCDGLYESHVNFFIAAASFEEASLKAKSLKEFKAKKMHIDGLQELQAVSGYDIKLDLNPKHNGETVLISNKNRERAPTKQPLTPPSHTQG